MFVGFFYELLLIIDSNTSFGCKLVERNLLSAIGRYFGKYLV